MNREPLHQAEWIVLKQYHLVFLTGTSKMHLELLSTNFMTVRAKAKMLFKYRLIGGKINKRHSNEREQAAFKHL